MLSGNRNGVRRTARGLLALMAGAWLLAAAAPCVMAQPMPMPADHAGCCPDKAPPPMADCGALTALDCQLSKPAPLTGAALDLPAPTPMLLHSLPVMPVMAAPIRPRQFIGVHDPSPPHVLNRKQSRLLI